jgi:hypothetical protein
VGSAVVFGARVAGWPVRGCALVTGPYVIGHPHEGLGDYQHGGALLRVADVLRCRDAIMRSLPVLLPVWHSLHLFGLSTEDEKRRPETQEFS